MKKEKRKPKQNKTKINVKRQVSFGFTIHITIERAGRAGTRRALFWEGNGVFIINIKVMDPPEKDSPAWF